MRGINMSLTRKDFEAIAKMINDNIILVGEAKGQILTEDFVRNMRDYLQGKNPKFDSERFINACYKKVD
jgi:hypothetical protein